MDMHMAGESHQSDFRLGWGRLWLVALSSESLGARSSYSKKRPSMFFVARQQPAGSLRQHRILHTGRAERRKASLQSKLPGNAP